MVAAVGFPPTFVEIGQVMGRLAQAGDQIAKTKAGLAGKRGGGGVQARKKSDTATAAAKQKARPAKYGGSRC